MVEVIGVVGMGFVGKAVANYFQTRVDVATFDIDPALRNCGNIEALVARANTIFVSVPTPMRPDGSCDVSIVRSVIDDIDTAAAALNRSVIVFLKSTVPPGTTSTLQTPWVTTFFNPEFLTEANADTDYADQERIILGAPRRTSTVEIRNLKDFFHSLFPKATTVICVNNEVAEAVKYATNTYLAMKVIFANELKEYAVRAGISYAHLSGVLATDHRLGTTHWKVPGPDGRAGFGGTCFPKDMSALLYQASEVGVEMSLLQSAWEKNLRLRPERDWEQLKGRAVVDNVEISG